MLWLVKSGWVTAAWFMSYLGSLTCLACPPVTCRRVDWLANYQWGQTCLTCPKLHVIAEMTYVCHLSHNHLSKTVLIVICIREDLPVSPGPGFFLISLYLYYTVFLNNGAFSDGWLSLLMSLILLISLQCATVLLTCELHRHSVTNKLRKKMYRNVTYHRNRLWPIVLKVTVSQKI